MRQIPIRLDIAAGYPNKNKLNEFIIETFTNGEPGVRELKRCIQTVVNKINLLRFYNHPKQIPFAIEGFALPFTLQKSHLEKFLKRKEANVSHAMMYM